MLKIKTNIIVYSYRSIIMCTQRLIYNCYKYPLSKRQQIGISVLSVAIIVIFVMNAYFLAQEFHYKDSLVETEAAMLPITKMYYGKYVMQFPAPCVVKPNATIEYSCDYVSNHKSYFYNDTRYDTCWKPYNSTFNEYCNFLVVQNVQLYLRRGFYVHKQVYVIQEEQTTYGWCLENDQECIYRLSESFDYASTVLYNPTDPNQYYWYEYNINNKIAIFVVVLLLDMTMSYCVLRVLCRYCCK
jgi:hypothetical protein